MASSHLHIIQDHLSFLSLDFSEFKLDMQLFQDLKSRIVHICKNNYTNIFLGLEEFSNLGTRTFYSWVWISSILGSGILKDSILRIYQRTSQVLKFFLKQVSHEHQVVMNLLCIEYNEIEHCFCGRARQGVSLNVTCICQNRIECKMVAEL